MKKIILVFLLYIFSIGIVPAEPIRLATTTSTENSGLLKVLIPHFEKQTGNVVHVLSVGTGHALRLGQDGNVTWYWFMRQRQNCVLLMQDMV